MLEKKLLLNNMDKLRRFVAIASKQSYDVELVSGRFHADGKSMLGIFALDLTRPVSMVAHGESCGDLLRQIQPFLYEKKK
ncbi:MAG: HPr family phosphocarrier protein [Clostridia bacterium]|nr:HPr family phosphocarrier protein [Clostridia bacterium]